VNVIADGREIYGEVFGWMIGGVNAKVISFADPRFRKIVNADDVSNLENANIRSKKKRIIIR
jgi:hypothetical protein